VNIKTEIRSGVPPTDSQIGTGEPGKTPQPTTVVPTTGFIKGTLALRISFFVHTAD